MLLDIHAFLWWLSEDPSLGNKVRGLMADPRNHVYVSAATTWEIAIKKAKGLLKSPPDLDRIVEDEGFDRLAISLFHGEQAGALPDIHRDPFDRMLIAQAQAEGLELVTVDRNISRYGVKVIDAAS